MTNLLAAIIVTIGTNWTTVGTFTPSTGAVAGWPTHDVQEGKRVTNTVAIMEWKGERKEFTIETQLGDLVGERKVPIERHFYSGPGLGITTNMGSIYLTNVTWPTMTNLIF